MGFWGLLADIAKALAPHAAPHVAKGVVSIAKDRMGNSGGSRRAEETATELGRQVVALQDRLSAVEDRAAAAEARTLAAEAELAAQHEQFKKWLIVLLGWNALLTILLIALFFFRK
ncbi:MAG: hypothetical protein DMG65_19945 [Candidatus Angelobacter sp. Gp1-AA117]|nr:MAG: hypothetical protein DMG65_19945 [Candidatus Angelobacter sp. Gp1-AA117]